MREGARGGVRERGREGGRVYVRGREGGCTREMERAHRVLGKNSIILRWQSTAHPEQWVDPAMGRS